MSHKRNPGPKGAAPHSQTLPIRIREIGIREEGASEALTTPSSSRGSRPGALPAPPPPPHPRPPRKQAPASTMRRENNHVQEEKPTLRRTRARPPPCTQHHRWTAVRSSIPCRAGLCTPSVTSPSTPLASGRIRLHTKYRSEFKCKKQKDPEARPSQGSAPFQTETLPAGDRGPGRSPALPPARGSFRQLETQASACGRLPGFYDSAEHSAFIFQLEFTSRASIQGEGPSPRCF